MTQGQVGKANSTNRIPCTGHRACTRRSKAGTTATLPVWPGGRQSNNRKNKYIFFNITSSKKEKCRVFWMHVVGVKCWMKARNFLVGFGEALKVSEQNGKRFWALLLEYLNDNRQRTGWSNSLLQEAWRPAGRPWHEPLWEARRAWGGKSREGMGEAWPLRPMWRLMALGWEWQRIKT